MKYIKLFEAFESQLLSKTLKYLGSVDKKAFLDQVKRICNEIDFPYSQLKDEYFEYLPFNKAFNKVDGDDKIYKFWLDTNGNLVNMSLTDGIKKSGDPSGGNKYTIFGDLRNDVKRGLVNHLDKILIHFDDGQNVKVPATLYEQETHMYAIFSSEDCKLDGDRPYGGDWKDWGDRSWDLSGSDWTIWINPVGGDELVNKKLNSNRTFTKKDLDKSQFAIIFNTSKLDTSKKRVEIKSGREEMRSGATSLRSNKEIREENLEKRLLKIVNKELNIDNFNSLFDKVLFNKWIMFDISNSITDLENLINIKNDEKINPSGDGKDYMKMLQKWYNKIPHGVFRDEVSHYFSNKVNDVCRETGLHRTDSEARNLGAEETLIHYGQITGYSNLDVDPKVKSILNIIKKLYDKNIKIVDLTKSMSKNQVGKELLNKLFQLGELVTKKIKTNKIEDLDDIFVVKKRMNMILDVLKEVGFIENIRDIIYLLASQTKDSTPPTEDKLKSFNENIDKTIRIINKL